VKQLSKGAKLLLPVAVDGALFSTGDGHFAQGERRGMRHRRGDGRDLCRALRVHRGGAERRQIRWPRFQRNDYFIDPRWAAPSDSSPPWGCRSTSRASNQGENLNTACRSALLNMIALLQERGFTREQAYVICSVAVDLRISNVVDVRTTWCPPAPGGHLQG